MGRRSRILPAPPKEPVLSRRHRAPAAAPTGASRLANARLALQRSRSRIILVLGMACGALLIAAPLALFLTGGPEGDDGTSRDPEGVFTGGPGAGSSTGPGAGGAGIATESTRSPAPGLPSVDVAGDPAGARGDADGAVAAGGTGAGGNGAVPASAGSPAERRSGGTAAGAPAPAPGGSPGGAPADDAPAPAPPARPAPAPKPGGGSEPAPQPKPQPQQPPPDDCGCGENPLSPVTDVVGEVIDGVTRPVGGLLGGG